MKKTFYSVKCAVWGGHNGQTTDIWFDNLTEAKKFAAHDFRDAPVTHTFSRPEKIAEIESLIYEQNAPFWR